MARVLDIVASSKEIRKSLARLFQSGHVNFLLGSGASLPAISIAGPVEQQINSLVEANNYEEAKKLAQGFLESVQAPTNTLIEEGVSENNDETIKRYKDLLGIVEIILTERKTTLLPKQATIFTTNYDLFIEKASINFPALKLNDGFSRVPSLDGRIEYSPRNFFNTIFNTGNLYDYKVEIPCVNLIKLHGSLSWKKDKASIVFGVGVKASLPAHKTPQQIDEYINNYAIVLPQATKFRTTVVDRTYYELLRIFANELDRENTLLVAFGFSFGDEHILDITKRALKNPTLKLIVFAFDNAAKESYVSIFAGYGNVDVVAPLPEAQINFERFNTIMQNLLPKEEDSK